MILERVKIHNFFRIKDSEVSLGTGLFHVFGQNKDDLDSISNGSGKSSFCESIFWCLFGLTVRSDLNKNDVIGPFDNYCEVSITLLKDNQKIDIIRWRNKPGEKNNEPRIVIDGEDMSKHKNTDTFISSVLGFDSKIFLLAGFTNLGGESFCKMSSANKIKTLKDALEIAKFDKYDTWCRAKAKDAEKTIVGLSEEERYTEVSLERLVSSLDNLESGRHTALSRKEKRLQEIQDKIDRIKKDLQTYLDGDYGSKHKNLRLQMVDLEREISCTSDTLKDLKAIKDDLTREQNLLEKKKRTKNEKELKVEQLKKQIDNLLSHDSDCSYCGSKIKRTGKTSLLIREFETEKEEISLELIDADISCQNTENKVNKLKEKVIAYDDNSTKLIDLKTKQLKLQEIINQIKNLYHTYKVNEESLLELMTEKQRVEREDVDAEYSLSADSLRDSIEREKETLKSIKDKQLSLNKRLDSLEHIRKIIKILKKDKLENFIESLVVSINHYLEKICGSIECEAFVDKESLVLKYRRGSGEWQPFSVLSSGEQTKVNKSVSFALNEMFEVGLMIDDEGLQGLDDEGSKLILEHLNEVEFDSTVIFVSHQQDVQQFFSAGQAIVATKEDGIIDIRR